MAQDPEDPPPEEAPPDAAEEAPREVKDVPVDVEILDEEEGYLESWVEDGERVVVALGGKGKVKITQGSMEVICDNAVLWVPAEGGPGTLYCEGNIRLKQADRFITGDHAVLDLGQSRGYVMHGRIRFYEEKYKTHVFMTAEKSDETISSAMALTSTKLRYEPGWNR